MNQKSFDKPVFYITNISKYNVCLADLAITIHRGRSYNLLDKKRGFNYTLEQLEKSKESGSLYKKRDKICVSYSQPTELKPPGIELSEIPVETRLRTAVELSDPEYEELLFSDEKYAEEMSELLSDDDK
jgi:hypothetical protein